MPSPAVQLIPPSHGFFVGSSANFTCVVTFNDTVDVPLEVEIVSYYVFSRGPIRMENYTQYSRRFTFHSFKASDSGTQFPCFAFAAGNSPFILSYIQIVSTSYQILLCK